MRKEAIIAVVAGLIIGVIAAFGIWQVNSQKAPQEVLTSTSPEQTPTPVLSTKTTGINLTQPQTNSVLTSSPTTLTGITQPNTLIAISGEEEDYTIVSNVDGSFTQEVELVSGVNQIKLFAFDQSGQKQESEITVVYSTEFKNNETSALQIQENGS